MPQSTPGGKRNERQWHQDVGSAADAAPADKPAVSPAHGFIAFALLTLTAAIALGGCGGASAKLNPNVIARVGNMSISEAELNHVISVEATIGKKKSGANITKPVVLQPPNYTSCVAEEIAKHQSEGPASHRKGADSASAHPASAETASLSAFFKTFCASEYEKLEPPALEGLIYQDWILGEAANLGLKVSSADVTVLKAEVAQKIAAEVAAKAKSQGVTHAQILAYYKQNLGKYEAPERRDVQLLLTEGLSAAEKARREISSGESFTSVDKRVSKDPEAADRETGGELIGLERSELEAEKVSMPGVFSTADRKTLVGAIFAAKEHVLEGPLKTQDAYYVFIVKQVKKREPPEPLVQVESAIKQTLTTSHEEAMSSSADHELEKRWTDKTSCAKGFIVSYCEQEQSPKSSAPTHEAAESRARQAQAATEAEGQAPIKLRSAALTTISRLARANQVQPSFTTRYTCYGADISPPLAWGKLPRQTAEVFLLVERVTKHQQSSYIWTVGGISPSTHSISAGSLPPGAVVGRNRSGKPGWGGVCPPPGAEYHYTLTIAALGKKVDLKPGFEPSSLGEVLNGVVLSTGSITARYKHP